jgi:hypothetical protein
MKKPIPNTITVASVLFMGSVQLFTSILSRFTILLILLSTSFSLFAQRTVFDNDRGNYYQYPYNMDFTVYGAFGGQPCQSNNSASNGGQWYQMLDGTVKSTHARYQHFFPEDTVWNNFPYSRFDNFSANEQSQNRTGLWVTKTVGEFSGKVGFSYTGVPFEGNPIFNVVHFSDRRYVKFFVNEFCRANLQGEIINGTPIDEPFGPTWKDLIVGIDNYTWDYGNYGYYDNTGNFTNYGTGFRWDVPYPQNNNELLKAVVSFQTQLKNYAPDVPIMFNGGGVDDTLKYDQLFGEMAGSFREGFMSYFQQGYWDRLGIYWQFQVSKWMDKHDKINIFQGDLSNYYNATMPEYKDVIRTMTCAYLIGRGQNSFFGLARDTVCDDCYLYGEILPENYQYIKDWMGLPQAPFTIQLTDNDIAYGLYKRKYDGGYVFLNVSGVTQTIDLGGTFYDRNGTVVTSITLPDFRGDFVRYTALPRPPMVSINNRYSKEISGSVSVKMACATPQTTIRYTTNGTTPDINSTIYTMPITLSQTTTVKAIAFKTGYDPSFVNTAVYHISPTLPTVSFHLDADTISEFLSNGYALVKLNFLSSSNVSVNFSVLGNATNGSDYTLSNGTVQFAPFEQYRVIRIPVIDDNSIETLENIRLTLSSPVGATMGSKTTFDYYILDNDGTSAINYLSGSNQISIYPNPANSQLHIDKLNANATVTVIGIDGNVIVIQKAKSESVVYDVSNWAKGLYIVQVQNAGTIMTQKVIVQ